MPLMRCVSNTAKTSVSSGVTWNSQSWALGPGGNQAVSSKLSDQRQRTPDGQTCCDGDVAWRVDGGWQNGAAGDWQLLTLECNIRLDTAEPCLEDTDLLLLQVCAAWCIQERRASVAVIITVWIFSEIMQIQIPQYCGMYAHCKRPPGPYTAIK